MKKSKNRSSASLRSAKSEARVVDEIYVPPLDILNVNIKSLRITDNYHGQYAIKVTFFDQLLIASIITSIGPRTRDLAKTIAFGCMNYDPSDYEKMCLFADSPLVVSVQPIRNIDSNQLVNSPDVTQTLGSTVGLATSAISCCNVDILPLFINKERMYIKKRLQPLINPSVLYQKSWDNLPVVTMELIVTRNPQNERHHEVLKEANYMKLTIIGSYNMLIPYDNSFVYTAATKTPLNNEMNTGLVTFNQGYREPRRFNYTKFYSKWESLRLGEETFADEDEKFTCDINEIQNNDGVDLNFYLSLPNDNTTIWGSFHRTLMLQNSGDWLWKHLRRNKWPLEVHMYGEEDGYSFMAFLDLFKLLYPGETKIVVAAPLYWINSNLMIENCNCEILLTPNKANKTTKATRDKPPSTPTSASTDVVFSPPTGANDDPAFVIVEIKFARSLKKAVIPPHISNAEIQDMLLKMEEAPPNKRDCNGRGQLERSWQATVKSAVGSIRRVPYYGMTEFCAFNRQLSETRTRVEIMTSCWQDAAIYINNNFVIQDYLKTDQTFEELLMMAHVCLLKSASDALIGVENWQEINPILRSARHARQMQDISHAVDLYLQLVCDNTRDPDIWRELSTSLKDLNWDWAVVCLNKSIALNPRHPLTLLSKGAMLFDEKADAAQLFFISLLALYPLWTTGLIAANAYFLDRGLYNLADQILIYLKKTQAEGLAENFAYPRAWERELGDWWENTPLLPGMNQYYAAADLLLRLRAISLAEVCVSRALSEEGESAAYFHLLALCCRLRGDIDNALCHLQLGIEKFRDISYLRSLEAECYHKQNNCAAATVSFEKSGSCLSAYSILLSLPSREQQRVRSVLVDVLRRQPNAYAWMALADDWITRAEKGEGGDAGMTEEQTAAVTCAAACAVQALRWDRRAGRAWAVLATLVRPRARRLHCTKMAIACGYPCTEEGTEASSSSQQSVCHYLGKSLRECVCETRI